MSDGIMWIGMFACQEHSFRESFTIWRWKIQKVCFESQTAASMSGAEERFVCSSARY